MALRLKYSPGTRHPRLPASAVPIVLLLALPLLCLRTEVLLTWPRVTCPAVAVACAIAAALVVFNGPGRGPSGAAGPGLELATS